MKKTVSLLLMMALVLVMSVTGFAHEGREVGEYVIVFGWRVEPAYAGVFNGPEITIEHHDSGEPLVGAEETLQLSVQFGDQTKTLSLYPSFGNPGHYTADLIPTRPGDYTFILTGTLDGVEVNETFTSADGEFSTVEPADDLLFPVLDDSIADLQAQINELRAQIEALQAQAGS